MDIKDTTDYIRQQQFGEFRRAEDGKNPYAHANGRKLGSTKEQEQSSFYIVKEKVAALKKYKDKDFPKLFDTDPGMKFETKKLDVTSEEKEPLKQYDKSGKEQSVDETVSLIDQWA